MSFLHVRSCQLGDFLGFEVMQTKDFEINYLIGVDGTNLKEMHTNKGKGAGLKL